MRHISRCRATIGRLHAIGLPSHDKVTLRPQARCDETADGSSSARKQGLHKDVKRAVTNGGKSLRTGDEGRRKSFARFCRNSLEIQRGFSSQLRDTTYLGHGSNGFSSGSSTPSFVSYDLGYFDLETQIKPSWSLVHGLGRLVDVRRTFHVQRFVQALVGFSSSQESRHATVSTSQRSAREPTRNLCIHTGFRLPCSYCWGAYTDLVSCR